MSSTDATNALRATGPRAPRFLDTAGRPLLTRTTDRWDQPREHHVSNSPGVRVVWARPRRRYGCARQLRPRNPAHRTTQWNAGTEEPPVPTRDNSGRAIHRGEASHSTLCVDRRGLARRHGADEEAPHCASARDGLRHVRAPRSGTGRAPHRRCFGWFWRVAVSGVCPMLGRMRVPTVCPRESDISLSRSRAFI